MCLIKERLLEFVKREGLTVKSFEIESGLSNGYVGSIKKSIGSKKMEQILQAFPQLSREWVLFGEGNMYKNEESETSFLLTDENGVKFYPELFVTGTNVEGISDSELGQDYRLLYLPGLEGCAAFPAVGESMMPTIVPGNIVVHKLWRENYIENGEVYVVVTRQGNRMIKRLTFVGYTEDGAMQIKCWSDNPDQERYAPFILDGNEIHSLALVKVVIPRLA